MSKLCFICCYSYQLLAYNDSQGGQGHESRLTFLKNSEQFKSFCEELEADHQLIINCLEDTSRKDLTICSECIGHINECIEIKLKVDKVEIQVRRLQRELLGKMKELGGIVDQFYGKMEGINRIVRNADVSCLRSSLGLGGAGGIITGKKNSVFMFREKISQVVEKMEKFRRKLNSKSKVIGVKESGHCLPVPVVKAEMGLKLGEEPVLIDGVVLEETVQLYQHVEVVIKEELGEDFQEPLTSPGPVVYWDQAEGPGQEEEIEPDEDPDYLDALDKEYLPPVPAKRTRTRSKKKKKKSKSKTSASKVKAPVITPKKSTNTSKSKEPDPLKDIDTSQWSDFKKRLVNRLVKRQTKRLQTPPSPEEKDPQKIYPLTYTPSTDTLSVDIVPILLIDDDPRTPAYLKCTQCEYQYKPITSNLQIALHNMEKGIVYHVLGHHLDAFQCPHCQKRLFSPWRFQEHLKSHEGCFNCSICGKPCATKDALEYHKWTHKSKQEQEDAIKNGVKNPKKYIELEKDRSSGTYFCATCGKGFKNPRLLRQHEDIHRKDREMTVCPKCGQQMLTRSYHVYHKNHGCSADEDNLRNNRVTCLECHASFKNVQFMKRHMLRVHSKEGVERPHVCDLCSKRFKAKGDLQFHLQIHSEDKLWRCGRGCGKEFSVKRYWRRHELVCDGSGGGGKRRKMEGEEEECMEEKVEVKKEVPGSSDVLIKRNILIL